MTQVMSTECPLVSKDREAVDKDIFLRCRDYMLNVVNQPGLQHAFLAGALRRLSGL